MQFPKRRIILGTYAFTAVCVTVYFIFVAFGLGPSESIALLFFPLYALVVFALLICVESVLFMLVFAGSFSEVRSLLLPVFLITLVVPIALLFQWYGNRPASIPLPGPLPVSEAEYDETKESIAADFNARVLPLWIKHNRADTVFRVLVDTIIYSAQGDQLLSFIVISAESRGQHLYWNNYSAGSRRGVGWVYSSPKGNVWSTQFESPEIIRTEVLEYFYNSYSINSSDPRKPEIWTDAYIFSKANE
jgi:hypothetical protein